MASKGISVNFWGPLLLTLEGLAAAWTAAAGSLVTKSTLSMVEDEVAEDADCCFFLLFSFT